MVRLRALTHYIADCRELPVLFCTQILSITCFECHPLSSPLDIKHCVYLADEERHRRTFEGLEWQTADGSGRPLKNTLGHLSLHTIPYSFWLQKYSFSVLLPSLNRSESISEPGNYCLLKWLEKTHIVSPKVEDTYTSVAVDWISPWLTRVQ